MPETFHRAGFFRRLAAMIYDLLVAVAVGLCAGLVFMTIALIGFEQGILAAQDTEHFMDFFQQSKGMNIASQIWVGGWVLLFFLWFWKNGGQTIGMRAWRLRLFSTNDKHMGYWRALLRIIASIGGLGTLLVLIDYKNKLSLQDRVAQTEMLVLSKDANHHKAWKKL